MKEQRTARVGSLIEAEIPNGLGIRNGKTFQEYKTVRMRVYIVNPDSLVCAVKGREGHPYVVESYKLIRW